MTAPAPKVERSLLEHAYHREKTTPNDVWMTQPLGGDALKTYTWKEAMTEARRMAAYLVSLELEPGSRIALVSKNCAEFILTDLAVWMAGHVTVPMYPTLNAETASYVLEHSEAKLLFVGKLDDWDEIKGGVPDSLPCIAYSLAPPTDYPKWDAVVAEHEPLQGEPVRNGDELATIIYTSGSTGRPKGVMHSFHGMVVSAVGIAQVLETGPEDRVLSYLPLAHVFERYCVECQSIVAGFQLFFAESLDTFLQDLQRAKPTLFISVPRLWLKFQLGVFKKMPPKKLDLFLKIPILASVVKKKILTGLGLEHVRLAASGSAPIPPELLDWYRRLGLELLEGYGMTEDFAYSHASLPGRSRVGYVGHPNPGVEVKISEQGEVLIKSPGNMMGYYKEPDMTAECYTDDGYFRTGDRGERDDQGRLKITGRVKEIFKTSKGKYVAPAPIENDLNANHNVEMSCVTGSGHPQPYALVLLAEEIRPEMKDEARRNEVNAELEALLAEVNKDLESHERLQFMVVVSDDWSIENGLLTPTMKLKRNVVEDTYKAMVEGWYAAKKKVIWQ